MFVKINPAVTGLYFPHVWGHNIALRKGEGESLAKLDDLNARVAGIEGWLKGISIGGGVLLTIALGLASWALVSINNQGKQIVALQTYVTHQLPQIALNILSRPTPNAEVAAQNLDSAKGIIANARKAKISLDPATVNDIAQTVKDRSATDSKLPAYWQMASEVVGYRSAASSDLITPSAHRCLDTDQYDPTDYITTRDAHGNKVDLTDNRPDDGKPVSFVFTGENCTIDIGDANYLFQSPIWRKVLEERIKHRGGVVVSLDLTHSNVVYSGGPLIPMESLTCADCVFDFNFQQVPLPQLQDLTTELLTANFNKVNIKLGGADLGFLFWLGKIENKIAV